MVYQGQAWAFPARGRDPAPSQSSNQAPHTTPPDLPTRIPDSLSFPSANPPAQACRLLRPSVRQPATCTHVACSDRYRSPKSSDPRTAPVCGHRVLDAASNEHPVVHNEQFGSGRWPCPSMPPRTPEDGGRVRRRRGQAPDRGPRSGSGQAPTCWRPLPNCDLYSQAPT
ncbi:hypothetical protein BD310DRAFT_938118 [Dichomitus squalens]|uniref:Uncharacterized protein n=1 Tax=Dichomitus squalens TaxID=114155 RepID=A0A4Q9PF38_9APHY|nr:hypothetical protein BD310DRAFT_938118 [Dichomitus squalens]